MAGTNTLEAEILGSAPDPDQVRALAEAVIQAASMTRKQIAAEGTSLQEERVQLNRSIEKYRSDLADFESRRAAWLQKEEQLSEQEAALAQAHEQVFAQERSIQEQTCVLGDKATRLEQLQAEVATAEKELRNREQSLQAAQREVEIKVRDLASKQREFDIRALDLHKQTSELEQRSNELEELREALTEMQAQLTTDHNEVTAHREELLKRLSRLPDHHAEHQEPMPSVLEMPPETNGFGAKPAAAGGVDQYRKLRRDAKRRAIGV